MTENPQGSQPDRGTGGKRSGAEVASAVLDGIDNGVNAVARFFMKLWAVVLIVAGVAGLFVPDLHHLWWASLLLIGYGIYLLFPGDKFVVW